MDDPRYFGTYARINAPTTDFNAALMGRDNMIGDIYDIDFVVENGTTTAWMRNRFGANVACFDEDMSYKLQILQAQGRVTKALLSFVAFTEETDDEPRCYWGEAAIISYMDRYEEAFSAYIAKISERMGNAIRPTMDLSPAAIDKIIETNGTWQPKDTVPLPEGKGTKFAITKSRRTIGDNLVEQGRQNNIGCYIFGYGAIIVFIVLIVLLIKALLGF